MLKGNLIILRKYRQNIEKLMFGKLVFNILNEEAELQPGGVKNLM